MKIFYTGIGAGKRQFFTHRTFRAMIAKSDALQTVIQTYDTHHRSYEELDLATICDIVGAAIL